MSNCSQVQCQANVQPTQVELITVKQDPQAFFRACAIGLSLRLQEVPRTTFHGMAGLPIDVNSGVDEANYKTECEAAQLLRETCCDFIGRDGNQEFFDSRLGYMTKATDNPDISIPYWQTDIPGSAMPTLKDRSVLMRSPNQAVGLLEMDALASALGKPIWLIGYSRKHNNKLTVVYTADPQKYTGASPLKVFYEYGRGGDSFHAVRQIVCTKDANRFDERIKFTLGLADLLSTRFGKTPYSQCI